jgi:hypothetical protein
MSLQDIASQTAARSLTRPTRVVTDRVYLLQVFRAMVIELQGILPPTFINPLLAHYIVVLQERLVTEEIVPFKRRARNKRDLK